MKFRNLGKSNLRVAPLAFGGNVFGWTANEAMSFRLLDAFVESGLNLIDTADVYSVWTGQPGISESLIGKWLKQSGKREKVVIATKVGMEMGPGKKGLAKDYIKSSIEGSLKRLQTDFVDLYQSHADDPSTPLEETLSAYADLIREGKVRAIGASNYTGARLSEALKVAREKNLPGYVSLQPQYNLVERKNFESDLEPVCREYGVGVISYFSLARGFLSGKYRSESDLAKSPRGQGVKAYLNERGFRILSALDEVAAAKRSTPAQIALAWLMARPTITAPIASATNLDQLKDLVAAAQLELDPASLERLTTASAY
jgi:aryl-alcohol dehydrogenase-like predicted oxidoreductase